jgi:ferredoxin
MRLAADRSVCVGAGQCVLSAPGNFDQSETDGTVVLLSETPVDEAAAREAAQLCPSGAISLSED